MTDMTNRDLQDTEIFKVDGENENMETLDQGHSDEHPTSPESFRAASYFVLFIAGVFVVNAMETGSYRTPWPVAIVTLLIGLGLFGYSWHLQSSAKTKK
jgi:hypothetical protein